LGKTVSQLLAEISSKELTEWMAFYSVEPFGEERSDIRAAIIACTCAQIWSKKKLKVNDFMPKFGPKPEQSPDQMKSILKALVSK